MYMVINFHRPPGSNIHFSSKLTKHKFCEGSNATCASDVINNTDHSLHCNLESHLINFARVQLSFLLSPLRIGVFRGIPFVLRHVSDDVMYLGATPRRRSSSASAPHSERKCLA